MSVAFSQEFESWQEQLEDFLLQRELCVLILVPCLFNPCVIAVARKRPQSFCQKMQMAGYTWTGICPFPNKIGVGWLCCPSIVCKPVKINSHTTHQGTLGHSHHSPLSHCGLILSERVELMCMSWSPHKKKCRQEPIYKKCLLPRIVICQEEATTTTEQRSVVGELVIGSLWKNVFYHYRLGHTLPQPESAVYLIIMCATFIKIEGKTRVM